jgi:hypothetical protein
MAKTYYKLDADGAIAMSSESEEAAHEAGMDIASEEEIVRGFDGRLYLASQCPIAPEPGYAEKRALEYPRIEEQLDMLYHDMSDGTSTWLDAVMAIKAKYPKG